MSYVRELINDWQRNLDQLKSNLNNQLQNPQDNKAKIVDHTLRIFAKADNDERTDKFTKETQQDMTLVSRYLEMLAVFGPLDSDLNQKRVYSKAKAIEIKKKLDNPQMYPKNQGNHTQNN